MNKMKKVLMTMFGLVMLPLLFACSNNQSAGIEAIKSKGKLVVASIQILLHLNIKKWLMGKIRLWVQISN